MKKIFLVLIMVCIPTYLWSAPKNIPVFADREKSVQAFLRVHETVMSRRCTNCHSQNFPRQLETGVAHSMNMKAKITQLGHRCTSCHQDRNFAAPHFPPGAAHWQMPSNIKSFTLQTTAKELCELWKDPKRNFSEGEHFGKGRTPEELYEHVTNDPLIQWAWNPGPGREPIRVPRKEFLEQFELWVRTGAYCPGGKDENQR